VCGDFYPLPGTCAKSRIGVALADCLIITNISEAFMARITVEDCQERVNNRFLLVQMAIKRVHQYRQGYPSLIESRNKEVVTALREIAAAKIMPDDLSCYTPPAFPVDISKID
jgi:DNA-directed RNA polymerase subunit omega